jgi:hypothetical protein
MLGVNETLLGAARVPALAESDRDVGAAELAVLALTGAGAAAISTLVDLNLRIPGHSILLAVFPMALGLALVPRRGAGSVMGFGAAVTTLGFGVAGVRLPGIGALTSLLLVGPFLDLALRWSGPRWQVYGAFALAGVLTNGVAFAVRAAAKLLNLPVRGVGRVFQEWWPQAVATYAAAGLVAGLVSAAAWFHHRRRDGRPRA